MLQVDNVRLTFIQTFGCTVDLGLDLDTAGNLGHSGGYVPVGFQLVKGLGGEALLKVKAI